MDPTATNPKGYQKRIWLITYGSSCTSITHKICAEGGIQIDECYTLTQRDLKYTVIHIPKKQTITAIQRMLKHAETLHGVKATNIFGYECIVGNDSNLQDHPGIQLMIEHMNKKSGDFEYWMLKGDIYSNLRGILHKFMINDDRSKMTRSQLEFFLKQQESKYNAKVNDLQQQLIESEQANEIWCSKYDELKEKHKKARIEISDLKSRLSFFEAEATTGTSCTSFTPIYCTETRAYAAEDDRRTPE